MSVTIKEIKQAIDSKKKFYLPVCKKKDKLYIDLDWQIYFVKLVNEHGTVMAHIDNFENEQNSYPDANKKVYLEPLVEYEGKQYIQVDERFLRKHIAGIDFTTHHTKDFIEALKDEIDAGRVILGC